ncbi:ATP-grasp domain-containing protein [Streptomyces endophyticus]|uniref:ATP-grasp domain-containing protein n=1 Tax=Streptomyces endophyticus TaxID=714166 RepID=A0ABU6F896_9ACTN|nr:ATP-grasp domain-containing protein [Streptomyces endophyticus]MEB8340252.1 ATP-grasp domain-containing protein [Streptomyces endophyticus]
MPERPHLLVLSGWAGVPESALALGFDVSFIGDTTEFSDSDREILARCRSVHEMPANRAAAVLAAARDIHVRLPLEAAVSFGEFGTESSAVVADALGIRGLSLKTAAATHYKDLMRAALAGRPDLTIAWERVTDPAGLRTFRARHGLPLVVKPVSGAGSVGVRQIFTDAELDDTLDDRAFWREAPYLAEEFVPGDMVYSVETVTLRGRHHIAGVSAGRLSAHPNLAITEISVPPPPPYDAPLARIHETVLAFLDVLGHDWGLTHTEVKVAADGRPVVIESQPRIGGMRIFRMVEHATGVDEVGTILRSLLPDAPDVTPPHLPPYTAVGMCLSLVPPSKPVRRTADPELLREIKGVDDFEIAVRPGRVPAPVTDNSGGRPGLIWLRVPDHAAAELVKKEISRTYWVEYEDGDVWHPWF